ncbi:MAG: hypothetical protein J0L61_12245 [Planctomycetes bacterium]|nr:hypothetical protein [Planctomycetota bacterium]
MSQKVEIELTPADHTAESRILIVTGAHLRAEAADRPLAYRLRAQMLGWWDREGLQLGVERPSVIVCSDVWYLNNDDLRSLPTVSIGGPGVNALSAFLTDKLPGVFTVQNILTVQMDIELVEAVVNIWGMDHATTVGALDAFVERYLDIFMRRACTV